MKQFAAFIRKEFRHILRDRRTMLILIGMPIVQIILFGFAISTEVKDVRIAVLTTSTDADTRYLIDRLDASEYFIVNHVVHSMDEVNRLFRQNQIELAVALPSDLRRQHPGDEKYQLLADGSDPNQAMTRTAYANAVLAAAEAELLQPASASILPASNIRLATKFLYNPQLKSAYNFVPGVMGLILMLICAMMTSISIVREKETGTMEQLLISPVPPLFVILAKAVPYFVLSVVNLTTILLLAVFVLDVPIAGNFGALIIVSLLFIFVSLALGLLISCVTRTQVAAMLVAGMVLMIPTIILSGLIFPIESMPLFLQVLSSLIPARWYIDLVRKLMIEGIPFAYVWHEAAVLLLMAIVLVGITTKKFKNRLE